MYQSNNNIPDEKIEIFFNFFLEYIKMSKDLQDRLDIDPTEWNMELKYTPNHACIWNKISNIGKECGITFKNDKFALVQFEHYTREEFEANMLSSTYRLEDLTIK